MRRVLPTVSVTILTKNSEKTLARALNSVAEFSEVLILDTGSTDRTKDIALRYPNVRWIEVPFEGFGKLHNRAVDLARHDWIFSIDSDEVVSQALCHEILSYPLNSSEVYAIDRHNYFAGKRIRCCSGWYPDRVVRLFCRKTTRFTESDVHEAVIVQGLKTVRLKNPCYHTPYQSIDAFLSKMQLYSSLFVEENKGRRSSFGKAVLKGFAAFFKNYFLKKGFLGGREGLILSLYNAHTTYYKYLKLAFRNAIDSGVFGALPPELESQDRADSNSRFF